MRSFSSVWCAGLLAIASLAGCGGDGGSSQLAAAPGASGSPAAVSGQGGTAAPATSGAGSSTSPGAAGNGPSVPSAGTGSVSSPVGGPAGQPAAAGSGTGGAGSPAAGSGGTSGAAGMAGSSAGQAGSGTTTAATCSGKPGKKGNVTRVFDKEGASYITHYPDNLDPNKPVPLVFVAHGFTMSGGVMQQLTKFDAVADANGFVVVYPDGDGGATPWNVGTGACAPGSLVDAPAADSFGYLEAMRAAVEQDQCIDAKKIFVTGFSMGGYFSHNVGCQRGNTFARAVGPHSGGTYPGSCPGAPVPIFIMHGDADTFIDYTLCGMGARGYWLERNKCGTQFETKEVMGGSCDWYKDCDPNGQVVFCSFRGVGHAWAGGATDAVWNFFKSYL
ncbi:MAG TPA: PHB depolymerase family esterase [Polyangiales bacterium]|nr:PHB depolymerase family esterase [Polyangiales bacterium]